MLEEFQLVDLGEFARPEQLVRLRLEAFSAKDPFYDEMVRLPSYGSRAVPVCEPNSDGGSGRRCYRGHQENR